jgi:hypothetical protein
MLKCVEVLDVFQAHELIYVGGRALPTYSRQNFMRSCGWVFVIVEIAKILTSGLIGREIRVS